MSLFKLRTLYIGLFTLVLGLGGCHESNSSKATVGTDLDLPLAIIENTSFIEDLSYFDNPERGFVRTTSGVGGLGNAQNGDVDDSLWGSNFVKFKYRLADQCDDMTIPQYRIDDLIDYCQELRNRKMKAIMRIVYSNSGGQPNDDCNKCDADSMAIIYSHLDQLKPIIAANRDVLAIFDAGIFGAWGEWNNENQPSGGGLRDSAVNRRDLIAKLLEALPQDRQIGVRSPQYYREVQIGFAGGPGFTTEQMARLGFYNDCFLATSNDRGTWMDRENLVPGLPNYDSSLSTVDNWKAYVRDEVLNSVMGGETCTPGDWSYSECANAIASMKQQRWTYLNNEWYGGIYDNWVDNGCFNDVRRDLGYRLVVRRVAHSDKVAPGGEFDIDIDIENMGYAAVLNERPVFVVLDGPTKYRAKLELAQNSDPRYWYPEALSTLSARLRIPADAPEGNYDVRLHLPDAFSNFNNPSWPHGAQMADANYAIRLSNIGTWNASTGENSLVTMAVDASAGGTVDLTANLFEELPPIGGNPGPSCSILSPTDGAIVSGTINASATASDADGVARVELFINGLLDSTDSSAPFDFTVDTTALSDGLHSLVARAFDTLGNSGNSTTVSIDVDNGGGPPPPPGSDPVCQIVTPVDGATVSGSLDSEATATDADGIERVELFLDGALHSTEFVSTYDFTIDTTVLSDGLHTLVAKAFDNLGNQGDSASVSINVDNGASPPPPPPPGDDPVCQIILPLDGATVMGNLNVEATATDLDGIARVELYLDGVFVTTDSIASFDFIIDTTLLTDGQHTLLATAFDTAGNAGSSVAITVSVNNTPAPIDDPPSDGSNGSTCGMVPGHQGGAWLLTWILLVGILGLARRRQEA